MENSINDSKTLLLAKKLMEFEEYYSIEDYGNLLNLLKSQTYLQENKVLDIFFNSKINMNKNNEVINTTIRANFCVDGKEKEILIEKSILNKAYAICKLYSENNKFIKILVNRAEKYDTNEILKKINENRIFRGVLKCNLNVNEFPIKTYYLEERKIQNTENNSEEVEKEFILKKINNNINQNIMNDNFNLNN